MPIINLNTGIYPNAQIPLDAKLYFKTISEMQSLGNNNYKAYSYYKGMVVYCVEDAKTYVWDEYDENIRYRGLLLNDFVYPQGIIVNGIDYSNKRYNFYEYPSEQIPSDFNRIISGSVYWDPPGYGYRSTPIVYSFNGSIYRIPETTLMLSPSDPDLNRIDVFVVDIEEGLKVIEGVPSLSPLEPSIDFTRQLRVTSVYVSKGSTEPSNTRIEVVYDENLGEPSEWAASHINIAEPRGDIYLNSGEDPYMGSVSIKVGKVSVRDFIRFKKAEMRDLRNFTSLHFKFKPAIRSNFKILISIARGPTKLAQYNLAPGTYGFDPLGNSEYVDVDIPLSLFMYEDSMNPEFDTINLSFIYNQTPNESPKDFKIDLITLIGSDIEIVPQDYSFFNLAEVLETSFRGHAGKVWVVDPTERFLIPVSLPQPNQGDDRIVTATATKTGPFEISVNVLKYRIDGVEYDNIITDTLQLDPIGPGETRLDLVVMSKNLNLSVLTGDPGINPNTPIMDSDDFMYVCTVLVQNPVVAGNYTYVRYADEDGDNFSEELYYEGKCDECRIAETYIEESSSSGISIGNVSGGKADIFFQYAEKGDYLDIKVKIGGEDIPNFEEVNILIIQDNPITLTDGTSDPDLMIRTNPYASEDIRYYKNSTPAETSFNVELVDSTVRIYVPDYVDGKIKGVFRIQVGTAECESEDIGMPCMICRRYFGILVKDEPIQNVTKELFTDLWMRTGCSLEKDILRLEKLNFRVDGISSALINIANNFESIFNNFEMRLIYLEDVVEEMRVDRTAEPRIFYNSEINGVRNGSNTLFTIPYKFKIGSMRVHVNGVMMTKGADADFTEYHADFGESGVNLNRVINISDIIIFECIVLSESD